MDLQQIKYFLAIVDHGTFRAAAQHSHVTQPTLSAGIRKLEESVDAPLFYRGSRAAPLTPAGKQFLAPARESYNQLMAIRASLKQEPEKIVIGVQTNVHMDHIAPLVKQQRADQPHIFIELVVADDDELNRKLAEQQLDLIIVTSNTRGKNFVPLINEQLCLVVNESHQLAQESSVDLKVLENELFIERMNCSYWQEVNQAFQQQSVTPNTIMQAESDEFVLSLIAANLGVSIITQRSTPYAVKFIPITNFELTRQIGICHNDSINAEHIDRFYQSILQQRNI